MTLRALAVLSVALVSTAAYAGVPNVTPVPEPGALGLLAFGAAAAVYIARSRRK